MLVIKQRFRTGLSGPYDFTVYILNLQLQIGVCQDLRETLTFVYIYTYNNHALSRFVQLKIFLYFGEKF